MARPADYKILKDNRSSYNLIAHEQHVPPSPLFGPSPPRQGGGATQRDYDNRDNRNYQENRGGNEDYERERRGQVTYRAEVSYPETSRPGEFIKHDRHVPASPLYRPGGQGIDPRYGSAQGGRRDWIGGADYEVQYAHTDRTPLVPPLNVKYNGAANVRYNGVANVRYNGIANVRYNGVANVRYNGVANVRYNGVANVRYNGVANVRYNGIANVRYNGIANGGQTARDRYNQVKGFDPSGRRIIGEINHVPVSPLYRPGHHMVNRVSLDDTQAWQRSEENIVNNLRDDILVDENEKVPRPKEPPTPDYNTTQMNIPESTAGDTKLDLQGARGSQEDLRDYRQNNASWAGYQDRPVAKGPPYTDRPLMGTDRTNKVNPWTQLTRDRQSDLFDPRVGGHHEGIGLIGSRNGGALLFIRFPVGQGENVQVAAHAFLKSKTHDNGGRFLGLAKKVYDFGYEKRPAEAIGVYHFPNMDKAFLFFQMDPIIRQPDFPPPYGHAEMWIVSNAYLPDNMNLFNTFLLSEVELHSGKDKREFFETFQKPFESYLYKNGAMPFVVCSYGSYDRKSLRRHAYPPNAVVTCHLFQGLDHLNWITNDETYSKFRSLHNQMATEKCSIFSLVKEPFHNMSIITSINAMMKHYILHLYFKSFFNA
ncbi:hypothetical protein Btru_035249 [Bulinus truncatus]|nr:hypothetical protein Btru_035249 [Bulinus truncatus]